jgi:hypothetical protein
MARVHRAIFVFGFADLMQVESVICRRSRPERRSSAFPCHFFLPAHRIPMMRQLLDVMDEAEELPLRIDFLLSAQREAIEPLVVPDIGEHRFNRGKTLSV